MGFLTGVFNAILSVVKGIGQMVLWALMSALNNIIISLGFLLETLIGLLPDLPDAPDNPVPDATGWIAWFIPVGVILTAIATLTAAYVLLLLWRVVMKWVKLL